MEQQKKIGEIREEFKAAAVDGLPSFMEIYQNDTRSGVRKLVEQAEKRLQKLEEEKKRIEQLKVFEKQYAALLASSPDFQASADSHRRNPYICGIRIPIEEIHISAALMRQEEGRWRGL